MAQPRILVTGANGQLGSELQEMTPGFPQYEFLLTTREELPVENVIAVNDYFRKWQPAFCINCAAYTAVDKAESEQEKAFLVNATAVSHLAKAALHSNCGLVHISTDYVFDGTSAVPYRETDATNPIGAYGLSKLKGEALCLLNNPDSIIIRTAWVYSEFGHNFVKNMIRLMRERKEVRVVSDQVGSPTYAADLAGAIMQIIQQPHWQPGIYHYANTGSTSWYTFATTIRNLLKVACEVKPIPTSEYPTAARRPSFSLLDTTKILQTFGLVIPAWEESLANCLKKLKIKN